MKRFGLISLLSASYVGLLTFVFSTDYSRENSLGLHPTRISSPAKAFSTPVLVDDHVMGQRIAQLQVAAPLQNADALHHGIAEVQSPESANDN